MAFTPAQSKRALVIALVAALALVGAAVAYVALGPGLPGTAPVPSAPGEAPGSIEPTMTAADLDQMAAEAVVYDFYDALNHDDLKAAASKFTTSGAEAVTTKRFGSWEYTAFILSRSIIETDSAQVFGGETRKSLTAKDPGLRFTLARVDGQWRIVKWEGVGLTALRGAKPGSSASAGPIAFNDVNSRDIVSTLMQARQAGDAATLRLLTTANFQSARTAWFNGTDNSSVLTTYAIGAITFKSPVYVVTVTETWNGKAVRYTYSVVRQADEILVDATTAP